jgi:hypothetical protein
MDSFFVGITTRVHTYHLFNDCFLIHNLVSQQRIPFGVLLGNMESSSN